MRRTSAVLLLTSLTLAGCGLRNGRAAPDPPEGSTGGLLVVTLEIGDVTPLDVTEMGQGSTWLVLAHGVSSRRDIWYAAMDDWASAGYHVLAYDTLNPDARESELRAVVDQARAVGAEHVVIGGSSAGASAAVELARTIDVDAVIAVSGGSSDPAGIDEPVLFVSSDGDDGPAARERAAAFGTDPVIVDGETHGADLFAGHPEAIEAVTAWLITVAPPTA